MLAQHEQMLKLFHVYPCVFYVLSFENEYMLLDVHPHGVNLCEEGKTCF